jgi:hypothetical protein
MVYFKLPRPVIPAKAGIPEKRAAAKQSGEITNYGESHCVILWIASPLRGSQ